MTFTTSWSKEDEKRWRKLTGTNSVLDELEKTQAKPTTSYEVKETKTIIHIERKVKKIKMKVK